ncbi:tail assembly protein [Pseudomonas syringae]|uniref:Tail assembly protein n=1 Tax=Pseudomonas syringae UB303 TaxID=1357287 RepID=A0AAJ4E4H5_PSESX|nr:tail assembly protein [Pseudomonas syringae]MCH5555695.1 tail assembly protein [Pseudomonas syringae pv. syringae]MCH5576321.1 tail assembly protein [Pseudomonas syringae pv. syringae]MCH5668462.1 tail assembly protein [Pseudomonas syringae pv. syringae]MDF5774113.1 tail assembly protein [Pseudomonas syringae pv. syringae]QHF08597.1 tail assembly protein [Pseudomonas syringae UB303]
MAAIHYSPMTTIKLSGSLARKFGRVHRRQIDSGQTWEVFKALKATLEGFADEIRRLDRLGMRFAIFRNGKNVGEEGFGLGGSREVRVVPVLQGSKRGGLIQTVLGVVLIAASYFGAPTAPVGFALLAGGVIQMLSPQAAGIKQSAAPENQPSYAFGSAKNTTASGNPVPICIGERRWGGAIISASIYAEDKT